MNDTATINQPLPRKGKAWLIIIASICATLIAAYLLLTKARTTINYQERSKAPIGLRITKTEPFKALSIVYAQGLGRHHTGQALHEYKSIFLLKNLKTLRFGVQYNQMMGVEKVWVREGNKRYEITRERQRPGEKAAPSFKVEMTKGKATLDVTGAEAEKDINHYIPIAEKKLEAARQKFSKHISKAEDLRQQWEKEHPRPPRKRFPSDRPGQPPDKNPGDFQGAHRAFIMEGMEQFRQGNHSQGAELLIDAILELKPKFVMLEQRFVDQLLPIKELFKQGKFQEGARLISGMLAEINQAYPNQIPHHPRGPSQSIAQVFLDRMKLAVEYIQNEALDIGAIFILEALVLVAPR
ncbi:hypothetical protein JXB28_00295 [Candidatus Woesearchaeota archaeon]|nr:hypothetical protein [Candidatus Woesearchaeota archaeon]